MNTQIRTWPKQKKRKYLIISISKIRNIRSKSKNYYLK